MRGVESELGTQVWCQGMKRAVEYRCLVEVVDMFLQSFVETGRAWRHK